MVTIVSKASPASVSQSTGYFELQLITVENLNGELADGECCDGTRSPQDRRCSRDECDTYFKICLKEYQIEVVTKGTCTYGSKSTQVVETEPHQGQLVNKRGSRPLGRKARLSRREVSDNAAAVVKRYPRQGTQAPVARVFCLYLWVFDNLLELSSWLFNDQILATGFVETTFRTV
ncbi:hypothetical protein NHX12_025976 [Muraenolepis orangiensis]|uniref:Notch ligand N-terminal domain-containing protein n=1 Tax=Muraenolepis orangiensis TaxID=630683 RepID=A0A9Q0EJI0_9TELE|nr:hypothetical protein NHX12_025976 [Muraenolepis orangiensis]